MASEKCRLCLKVIPSESVIKLYYFLGETNEPAEMVKLIAKYLSIKVKKDDVVSTTICQDCNDHLEEFHKFSENVAAQQLTLSRSDFWQADLKKETVCVDDDDNIEGKKISSCLAEGDAVETKITTPEQAMFEYPIDVKDEVDSVRDADELCVQDMLEADLNEGEMEEEYKPPENELSSEDDMPLIQLRTKKKKTKSTSSTSSKKKKKSESSTSSIKQKRDRSQNKPKQPKEPKPKKERQPKLSGQQLIATSLDLKCDICQTKVNTWKELRQHFLLAHTRTPYIKCCGVVYEKQRPLVDHLHWHKNPDAFKCQLCEEDLGNSRDLTTHISTKHPDNVDLLQRYECEHCFKQFRSFTIYKNHLSSHSKEQDVECHICNKRYDTEHQLERHMKIQHKDAPLHVCDICGKPFKTKSSFRRHYQLHQGNTGPAVQCSKCKTWLKDLHSLRIHRFLHEETPQTCELCGKIFTSRRSLKRHTKTLHEMQTSLQCNFCDKTFRDTRNLHEHMAIHTGVQLYTCPHCSKESRSKSNMYVHIKRQHPDEWWKSKVERLNLDPNTVNPEITHHQIKPQQDYAVTSKKRLQSSDNSGMLHHPDHPFFLGFPARF